MRCCVLVLTENSKGNVMLENPAGYEIDRSEPDDRRRPRERPKPALRIVSGYDLDRQDFPPINYVIPGFICEGVTLLAGKPKSGKSWMALDWALSIAAGGFAFGMIPVEQGDVLYLALEDNQRRLQKRQRQLLGDEPKPPRIAFATECPTLDRGGLEGVRQWCLQAPRPLLIVVDVLAKVRPEKRRDEGLYDADYRAIGMLKALAEEFRLSILVIHHTSKRTDALDAFDNVSGTTAMTGAVDTALILQSSTEGPKLYGRGRDIEEFEKAVRFDQVTGRWSVLGNADEVRLSGERKAVLDVLHSATALMGPGEIAAAVGKPPDAIRQLLVRMTNAGDVIKEERGRYRHSSRIDLGNPRHNRHNVTRDEDREDGEP